MIRRFGFIEPGTRFSLLEDRQEYEALSTGWTLDDIGVFCVACPIGRPTKQRTVCLCYLPEGVEGVCLLLNREEGPNTTGAKICRLKVCPTILMDIEVGDDREEKT